MPSADLAPLNYAFHLSVPLIATALFAAYHTGYAISIYIAACTVVSLISAAFMPDYTGKDISREYDRAA